MTITPTDPLANDPINHPKHYSGYPAIVECIDVTRHLPFDLGNAVKYLWRAGKKDPATMLEDLEKAAWYIRDYRENFPGPDDEDAFPTARTVFDLISMDARLRRDPGDYWRMDFCQEIVYGNMSVAEFDVVSKIDELKTMKGAR